MDHTSKPLFSGMIVRQQLTSTAFRSACAVLEQFVDRCCETIDQLENQPSVSQHLSDTSTKALDSPHSLRRSSRQSLAIRKLEHMKAVLDGSSNSVELSHCPIKGRSVIARQQFYPGDCVIEYFGELISSKVAELREKRYEMDDTAGCYMFYFRFDEKWLCIDATAESPHLGRIVNHSVKHPNLRPRLIVIDGKPRVFFFANSLINIGDELLYDYGDHSKNAVHGNPWLETS